MTVDAVTFRMATVIAMETNWMPRCVEVPARQTWMPMAFVTTSIRVGILDECGVQWSGYL